MKIIIVGKEDVADVIGGAKTAFDKMLELFASFGHNTYGVFYSKTSEFTINRSSKNSIVKNLYDGITSQREAFESFANEIQPDLIIFHFPHLILEYEYDNQNNLKYPTILMFHSRPDFYKEHLDRINFSNINLICTTVLMSSFSYMLKKYVNVPVIPIGNEIIQQTRHADLSSEKKNIIFYSRIDGFKGIDFLIDSFALIADKIPDWTLNIYGSCCSDFFKYELLRYIKKRGLSNQVNICGCIHSQQTLDAFLNSDICVYPSLFEGFGIGLAEALSFGLPCIGLKKATAVNELIKHNINGYLVNKSEQDFSRAILDLVKKPEKRIILGKNAIESIREYSPEIIQRKWFELLSEIESGNTFYNLTAAQEIKNISRNVFSVDELNIMSLDCHEKVMQFYSSIFERIFSLKNRGEIKVITILGKKIRCEKSKVYRIFSINKPKSDLHTQINFLGIKIKIKKNQVDKKLIQALQQQESCNKVLLLEANDFHGEILPGYTKYLVDLGFKVDVITTKKHLQDKVFARYSDDNVQHIATTIETIKSILKNSKIMQNYEYLFISSHNLFRSDTKLIPPYSIFDYFEEIENPKKSIITVEHTFDGVNKELLLKNKVITLANVHSDKIVVNPHFFGDIKITQKNKKTLFLVSGDGYKNFDLIMNAVGGLIDSGYDNFKFVVTGRFKDSIFFEKFSRYIEYKGYVDFHTLYYLVEEADFIVPCIDPEKTETDFYIKNGTSGAYQLSYGFLKPIILNKKFVQNTCFTDENSILYDTNADLVNALKTAIDMNQDVYSSKQENLKIWANELYQKSLINLSNILQPICIEEKEVLKV